MRPSPVNPPVVLDPSWRRSTLALTACAALQFLNSGILWAQDEHLGITEYEIACMPCHGLEGRGDGPLGASLKVMPKDLTQIARNNNGIFPAGKVAAMIDGRATDAAHGFREMPVWGDRYRKVAEPGESTSTVDSRARMQIDALVRYLEEIQER